MKEDSYKDNMEILLKKLTKLKPYSRKGQP